MSKKKITPRSTDYSQWYHDIVLGAELADYSPVKGAMVIRPNGYAIWENIQAYLDKKFKETGHQNTYFPLFIPESFIKKEAEHVEGFAPELAVVTHGGGKELEESLVVRPTSETMIWHMYKKWISSHRDLPILYNQWANVVRWEMRTRLFLRTTEFLWHETHTAHATEEEAREEALQMVQIFWDMAEDLLAIAPIVGRKTEHEKFAGAVETYSYEAFMQDGKAVQMGTSHYLGDNFSKAFDVKFQDADNTLKYPHATSACGATTRVIGALIMTHSDDQGLVLPPKVAPNPVVIVPIWKSDEDKAAIRAFVAPLLKELRQEWNVKFDDREEVQPGFKFNDWELKGVPLRMEIGPRDLANKQVVLARRDIREKKTVGFDQIKEEIRTLLDAIQNNLLDQARERRNAMTHFVDDYDTFKEKIEEGGIVYAHWCGETEIEKKIAEETKATIRCIPFEEKEEEGKCIYSGKPSNKRVVFAKAY